VNGKTTIRREGLFEPFSFSSKLDKKRVSYPSIVGFDDERLKSWKRLWVFSVPFCPLKKELGGAAETAHFASSLV